MSERLLKIEDLHVVYDSDKRIVFAVNGLDLELDEGETLGLVGETGAGKTTTALSIMRLLPDRTGFITSGSIQLGGVDVVNAPEKKMREVRGNEVSMIFQDPMTSLNPTMTVGDQIAEVLTIHQADLSRSKIQEQVDHYMKLVGLPAERKMEYPHQFSGGMKQRIVIAMALACQPKLLLADEPTTALDVTIQAQVLKLMRDLKEQLNTAMILITHDLGIVAEVCDKVAIMYAGQIVEFGSLEDIYTGKAHHPYTLGLFGAIPDIKSKAERLHPIDGLMPDPANLPTGCVFHPRCEKCVEKCKQLEPPAITEGTHMIRCHLFAKEGQ